MQVNRKLVGYGALVVAVLLALFLLALPPLLKHIAVQQIDQATGRKSEVAKISLNPFTLSAGIAGLRLSEKGSGATFLALSSARLSLSPLSLPKRSFIVTEVKLSSPYLHIVRNAANDFNFSDLLVAKKGAKKGGTPLFSVNNITIENGSVDFQDKALKVEKDHKLRSIALSVPFVSNMPYLADRYVSPHFSALVNGSPIGFDGRLKPLTRAVEATVELNVKHLDLPFYLGYIPFPLPVKVEAGQLTTALELGYRVDEKGGPELRVAGTVALDRAALSELNGAPLASFNRAQLKMKKLSLLSRRFDLSSLELQGMELSVNRDMLGVWNFQKIGQEAKTDTAQPEAAKPSEQPAQGKPIELQLDKLAFTGGTIHFSDGAPKGGFKSELHDIDLSLDDFSLTQGHKAPFSLQFRSSRGETAAIKGELAASPLELKASLTLEGIPLKDYYPYLSDTLTAPVAGILGLSADMLFNDRQGLVVERSALRVRELAAPFGGGDALRLKEVEIGGIAVDLQKRTAVVERVELRGGNVSLSKEKDGTLSALRLLRQKPEPAAAKGHKTAPAPAKRTHDGKETAPPPFSYRLAKIDGSDLGIRFTDKTKEEVPVFTLNRLKFGVAGITGPKQGTIPFTLAAGYGNKGRIQAAGGITLQPLKFKGNLALQGISLGDFDPYLPENVTVFIAGGALDTKLSFNLEQGANGFKGSFGGSLGVRSFYCQDTVLDEDLLKWEHLQIDKINGTLGPFTLAVHDVALSKFYSRIIVQKDGTLNVQHLMGEEAQGTADKTAPATSPADQSAPTAKTPPAAVRAAPSRADAPALPASKAAATKPAPARPAVPAAAKGKPARPPAQASAKDAPAWPPAQATAKGAQPPVPPVGGAAAGTVPPPRISIDTISLQGGTLAFSDRHLVAPFDTTFFNLGGRVSGLSSQSNRLADVDLRGNLENHSPLTITGTVNPLRGDLYLDMKISFQDIELAPFTPYANTYLGYDVDQGKLFLDLTYHIEKRTLSSQNKLFIDQFTFGKEVPSAKAIRLPVRLAIALLKDRKGEIHLDLPVAGRTDDPQFSVWKVVLHILKNLLVRAATSPFTLLSSLFGGSEDFSAVYFAAGSDRIARNEQDKLAKLSKAMLDRPALNMEISGFVDKNGDPEGFRNELLLKKMRGEKFRALAKQKKLDEGQTQDDMVILPGEYHNYLKAVYVKEKFPKPRNLVGLLKDLPDEEMKKLILSHTLAGDNELQALARERAEAVKAFLQDKGKVPPERLFEKSADIYKPSSKEGGSGSRVEFGAKVK